MEKQCKKCGVAIGQNNKSLLCQKCWPQEYYLKNRDKILQREAERRKTENYKKTVKKYKASPKGQRTLKSLSEKHYLLRKENLDQVEKYRENYTKWSQTPTGKFSRYKSGAGRSNREFSLTFEEFMTFWQRPCHYCGKSIETIGLDRIDNLMGYKLDNIVPCCRTCNFAKREQTYEEFLEWIRRAYFYTSSKKDKTA